MCSLKLHLAEWQHYQTGDIAYAVMTYASKDIEGHMIRTMETPAQQEKCVLEVLFDYKVLKHQKRINC